jgi:predicted transcriptional regulator
MQRVTTIIRKGGLSPLLSTLRYQSGSTQAMSNTVSSVMNGHVVIVNPEDTVQKAAKLMGEMDFGLVPVGESQDHLMGILTDRYDPVFRHYVT